MWYSLSNIGQPKAQTALEKNNRSLTDETHMRMYIPFLEELEIRSVRRDIGNNPCSLIFDGTTRVAECFAIVVRFLMGWQIEQRCLEFKMLEAPMDAEDVSASLLSAVLRNGIPPENVHGLMCDGTATNIKSIGVKLCLWNALQVVLAACKNGVHIICHSHTFNNVGSQIAVSVWFSFLTPW